MFSSLRRRRVDKSSGAGRKRKKGATWSAAVLALLGAGALSTGEGTRSAVAAAIADPLSIFAARSPGERGAGALTQSKPALANARDAAGGPGPAGAPGGPSERVLSTVRDRPTGLTPPAFAVPLGAGGPVALAGPVAGGIVPGGGIAPGGGGGGGGFIGPVDGGIIPGGGGGGGGGGIIPGPPAPPGPPSLVPEPAAWAMMIVGTFAIGGMLRRQRGVRARSPAEKRA